MNTQIEKQIKRTIHEQKTLKSGWAGEIIALGFTDGGRAILKTYQSSPQGRDQIQREWRGLQFLHQAGYPAPAPLASGLDQDPPYILMEEIAGQNFWDAYKAAPEKEQAALLQKFAQALYDLHQLPPQLTGESPALQPFAARELDEIETLVQNNQLSGFTLATHWLRANIIKTTSESILHRDYHPWNVMLDQAGRVRVLDLLWGIGDPRFDLAWTCTLMERSGFETFAKQVFDCYQSFSGAEIKDFDYFRALASLRWLANVSLSLQSGENLNETRRAEFRSFILPLIEKGWQTVRQVTNTLPG